MSHYCEMNVELNDPDCLVKALESLGFLGKVEVHQIAQSLYGYRGDVRQQKAHIIIRRKYVGSSSNDIGFERQLDGTYKAYISEYDRNSLGYNDKWLKKLKQAYTVEKTTKEAKKQGWSITKTKDSSGKVRLVLVKA